MAANECVTNKCVACNCSCTDNSDHTCTGCDVCKVTDDHTRKES